MPFQGLHIPRRAPCWLVLVPAERIRLQGHRTLRCTSMFFLRVVCYISKYLTISHGALPLQDDTKAFVQCACFTAVNLLVTAIQESGSDCWKGAGAIRNHWYQKSASTWLSLVICMAWHVVRYPCSYMLLWSPRASCVSKRTSPQGFKTCHPLLSHHFGECA